MEKRSTVKAPNHQPTRLRLLAPRVVQTVARRVIEAKADTNGNGEGQDRLGRRPRGNASTGFSSFAEQVPLGRWEKAEVASSPSSARCIVPYEILSLRLFQTFFVAIPYDSEILRQALPGPISALQWKRFD